MQLQREFRRGSEQEEDEGQIFLYFASRRAWRRGAGRCRTVTTAPAPPPDTPSCPPRRPPPVHPVPHETPRTSLMPLKTDALPHKDGHDGRSNRADHHSPTLPRRGRGWRSLAWKGWVNCTDSRPVSQRRGRPLQGAKDTGVLV
jgi:hypothetical protein